MNNYKIRYTYKNGKILYGYDSGDYEYILWLMRKELENDSALLEVRLVEINGVRLDV